MGQNPPAPTAPTPEKMPSSEEMHQITQLVAKLDASTCKKDEVESQTIIKAGLEKFRPPKQLGSAALSVWVGLKHQLSIHSGSHDKGDLRKWFNVVRFSLDQIPTKSSPALTSKQVATLNSYLESQRQQRCFKTAIIVLRQRILPLLPAGTQECQTLFKSLVTMFSSIEDHETKCLMTQILLQLMTQDNKLIKLANNPYFFLEFSVHYINQVPNLDEQLFWIETVGKLYESGGRTADEYLYYDNDLRALIDVIVRVMELCPDGERLRIPLKCYITLSKSSKMGKMFRLEEVREFLTAIDCKELKVSEEANKILSLT